MAQPPSQPREILAENLSFLMERRDWKQKRLEKESGVSQRHIRSLLRQQQDCTMDILSRLARAFKIPVWLLLVPDLPPDILDSKRLPELIDHYVNSGPKGQDFIDRAAEREAAHNNSTSNVVPLANARNA